MQAEYVLNTLQFAQRRVFEARASEDLLLLANAIPYR
jgi:anti-sigma-K factor RskA